MNRIGTAAAGGPGLLRYGNPVTSLLVRRAAGAFAGAAGCGRRS
ncbi:hypothetical protein AB0L41_23905 [Amycolatopsis mediterranei]